MRSDRFGTCYRLGNGQLDHILIGDSAEGLRDTAGGSGMHIWGSERSGLGLGVVGDCLGESGLPLDTTRVCLGPLGCHGYNKGPGPMVHLWQCSP